MAENDLGFDDDFMETMLSDFLDESQTYLTNLNDNLLTLDRLASSAGNDAFDVDLELLNSMFRDAHSLKGLSAMLQLNNMNGLTHSIENVFDAARGGKLKLNSELVELMFQGVDRLTGMIDELKESGKDDVEFASVTGAIQEILDRQESGIEQFSQEELEQAVASSAPPLVEQPAAVEELPPAPDEVLTKSTISPAPIPSDGISEGSTQIVSEPKQIEADPFAGVVDENGLSSKYLSIFVDETTDSLEELNELLISDEIEQPDAVDRLLVSCHRIKGSAASIGLNRPAKLAHLMEDQLQELREANDALPMPLCDAFLATVDALREYITKINSGEEVQDKFPDAYQRLQKAHKQSAADTVEGPDSPSEESEPIDAVVEDAGDNAIESAAQPAPDANGLDQNDNSPPASAQPFALPLACAPDANEGPEDQAAASALEAQQDANQEPATEALPDTDTQQPSPTELLSSTERQSIESAAPDGRPSVIGAVALEGEEQLVDIKVKLALSHLESLGELFFSLPTSEETTDATCYRLLFGIATGASIEEVYQQVDLQGVVQIALHEYCAEPIIEEPSNTPEAQPTSQSSVASQEPLLDPPDTQPSAPEPPPSPTATRPQTPATTLPAPSAEAQRTASSRNSPQAFSGNGEQKKKPSETLRVDIERLDQLMNLAGQLVINKARFGQIVDQMKSLDSSKQCAQRIANMPAKINSIVAEVEETSDVRDADLTSSIQSHVSHLARDLEVVTSNIDQLTQMRSVINELSDAVHQLERVSDGIQKSIMDTRMVPVGPLFGRFKRVVRDITRMTGKNIQLIIHGEKTELDKRMIDELSDPLIHMVRNSADHGIESPEARRAKGKPEQGQVTLNAYHRGNRVLIEVKDDGKGLAPEALKAKAIEKGIIDEQEAERLSNHQALQLIWEPGFSTAEQITEISGRGMGMDIVRSKIEQLSGCVDIDSTVDEGTTITIKLPLTMAILPSLLTIVGGDVFAVPVESVSEIISVAKDDLSTVQGQLMARVRDRVISVVELDELFHWNEAASRDETNSGELTLVVIGSEGEELGLAVDHLMGEQDIVIKSIAENFRNVHGLAGASILGDGRVSLILDVSTLLDVAATKRGPGALADHTATFEQPE